MALLQNLAIQETSSKAEAVSHEDARFSLAFCRVGRTCTNRLQPPTQEGLRPGSQSSITPLSLFLQQHCSQHTWEGTTSPQQRSSGFPEGVTDAVRPWWVPVLPVNGACLHRCAGSPPALAGGCGAWVLLSDVHLCSGRGKNSCGWTSDRPRARHLSKAVSSPQQAQREVLGSARGVGLEQQHWRSGEGWATVRDGDGVT